MAETVHYSPSDIHPANQASSSDAEALVQNHQSGNLDEVLEEASDHLQLQMLLIEVASCDD